MKQCGLPIRRFVAFTESLRFPENSKSSTPLPRISRYLTENAGKIPLLFFAGNFTLQWHNEDRSDVLKSTDSASRRALEGLPSLSSVKGLKVCQNLPKSTISRHIKNTKHFILNGLSFPRCKMKIRQ